MIKAVKTQIQKHWLLIYAMLASALILLFCSKSSPLYPINDWMDVHCFLTLGKGMLHGLVPYVDLYEQKGPVLYFIYAIVALFCQKSMFGQYMLEVVTFGLFLYYSAKLAEIYIGKCSRYRYIIIPILAAIVATTRSFQHGGSVEQMCIFTFVYGLYSVLKAIHEDRPLAFRAALTNGIFAGAALWIKYTMLGFYVGLALFVLVWYITRIRDLRKTMAVIGQFLLGIGIVSAVVVVYFLCVGGLKELITCYFYNNICLYRSDGDTPLFSLTWISFVRAMRFNKVFPIFLYIGLGWLLLRIKKGFMDLLAVLMSFSGLVIGTYISGGYYYYGLVLSAYTVFGLVAVVSELKACIPARFVQKITANNRIAIGSIITAVLIISAAASFSASDNSYLSVYEKEEMPQYKFAKIINETEDPTLLNFGFLDGGFYYAADVLPNCRFFCNFNIQAPGMKQMQYEFVRDGKVDYVVTMKYPLEAYTAYSKKYEQVSTAQMQYEGKHYTYYLYRLKELNNENDSV